MNILIGAHGTGKTTLTEEIKKIKPDIYITDGFSRPSKSIKNILKLDNYQEQVIINELTKWNWLNNLRNVNYLSTRSIIDCIVYSRILGFDELSDNCINVWNDHFEKSDIKLFYIPIEFEIEDDGIRFMDKSFQLEVDRGIRDFIKSYHLDKIDVRGNIKERVLILKKYI